MAFQHGKDTFLSVNGSDISPYTNTSDFDRAQDSHDVTAYGNQQHNYRGGLGDGTFSCGGTWDDTASTGPSDVIEPLEDTKTPVPIILQYKGAGSGLPQRSFNAILTGYSSSQPVDDMITWEAEFQISGAVDRTAQV